MGRVAYLNRTDPFALSLLLRWRDTLRRHSGAPCFDRAPSARRTPRGHAGAPPHPPVRGIHRHEPILRPRGGAPPPTGVRDAALPPPPHWPRGPHVPSAPPGGAPP
eukprot:4956482-Pyramimonas_sp.AAC.1